MLKQKQKNISLILWIFIFLTPFLDVFTSFMNHFFGRSSYLILLVKFGFLLFLLVFHFLHRNRKLFWYSVALFLYFIAFFVFFDFEKGFSGILLETQNLFRTFYFPVLFFALFSLQKEGVFEIPKRFLSYLLIFYLFFLVFPEIFHFGFQSYAITKVGGIGWFYSANEIGGILAILGPFFLVDLKSQKWWVKVLGFLLYFYGIFVIGSKTPILALSIMVFIFLGSYFFQLIRNRERKKFFISFLCSIVACILFGFLLLSSSFYKNIQTHLEFLEIQKVSDLFTFHHIDHFIFSERLSFLGNTHEVYRNASLPRKVFGIGMSEYGNVSVQSMKMIEMDCFDIFYHYGLVGLILFFFPLVLLPWRRRFSLEEKISIFLIFLLSMFTGHILVAPSVSLIVVLVLLSKKEEVKK